MGDDAIDPSDTAAAFMWMLVDNEARAKDDPALQLPSAEERDGIMPGEFAQLVLTSAAQKGEVGERVWVKVAQRKKNASGTFYKGRLVETPKLVAGLKAEDELTFEPRHVIGIERTEERAPAPKGGGGGGLLLLALLVLGSKRKGKR